MLALHEIMIGFNDNDNLDILKDEEAVEMKVHSVNVKLKKRMKVKTNI